MGCLGPSGLDICDSLMKAIATRLQTSNFPLVGKKVLSENFQDILFMYTVHL